MTGRLLKSVIGLVALVAVIPRLGGAARLIVGNLMVAVLLLAAVSVMFRIPLTRMLRAAHRSQRRKRRPERQWWEP